jgi:hypothetical protein
MPASGIAVEAKVVTEVLERNPFKELNEKAGVVPVAATAGVSDHRNSFVFAPVPVYVASARFCGG